MAQPAPQPEECVRGRGGLNPEDDLVSVFGRTRTGEGDFQARVGETFGEEFRTSHRRLHQFDKSAS